jgi:hypothetical protein
MSKRFPEPNTFEVGSQPPTSYVAWHEWAKAQAQGGLRQRQCKECERWLFPQEQCECKD